MNPAPDLSLWLSLAVLVLVAWPAGRVVRDDDFRRVFPRGAVMVGIGVLTWLGLVATMAVVAIHLLFPFAVVLGIVALLFALRARPDYGAASRLPPGSLSLMDSLRGLADRDFYRKRLARHGPIFKMSQFSGNVVCVAGLERSMNLFKDHASSLGPSPLAFTGQLMGGFLRYMDDASHDIYGPLFRRALSRPVVEAAESAARAAANREVRDWCSISGSSVFPRPALERIAYQALARALFGVEPDTPRAERFLKLFARLPAITVLHPFHRGARDVLAGLRTFALENTSGEPPLRSALTELRLQDPRMPDPTCLDNLSFMLKIATANTSGLLHWLVVTLAEHPEWRPRLREAASGRATGASPDALDAFVMETLRIAQSEYLYRTLKNDVHFEGYRLPGGWMVRILVAESHTDPGVFPDPRSVTDRFLGHRPHPSEYSPFGIGRHACNGVGLVSMIARVFLSELVLAPPLEIVGDRRPVRDLRHWSHWRPSPGLSVRFPPRSD